MFGPVIFAEPVMLFGAVIFCALIEVNPVNVSPKSTPTAKATVAIVVVENFIKVNIDIILLKCSWNNLEVKSRPTHRWLYYKC